MPNLLKIFGFLFCVLFYEFTDCRHFDFVVPSIFSIVYHNKRNNFLIRFQLINSFDAVLRKLLCLVKNQYGQLSFLNKLCCKTAFE